MVADIRAPERTSSIFIATASPARSGGSRFGCSAWSATRARAAHHLGRALQLTNILRDLDEDAGLGRLYLPREELQRRRHPRPTRSRFSRTPRSPCPAPPSSRRRRTISRSATRSWRKPAPPGARAADHGRGLSPILEGLVARGFSPPRQRVRLPKCEIPPYRAAYFV